MSCSTIWLVEILAVYQLIYSEYSKTKMVAQKQAFSTRKRRILGGAEMRMWQAALSKKSVVPVYLVQIQIFEAFELSSKRIFNCLLVFVPKYSRQTSILHHIMSCTEAIQRCLWQRTSPSKSQEGWFFSCKHAVKTSPTSKASPYV